MEIGNGLFEDHFEASVKMSSYLLAFIVCDFKSVSGITATGINVSNKNLEKVKKYEVKTATTFSSLYEVFITVSQVRNAS